MARDRNRADDVFGRDRSAGTTNLVSIDSVGAQRRLAGSRGPSLSAERDHELGFAGNDGRGSNAPALSGDGR